MLHKKVENKTRHIEEHILIVADHTHLPTTKSIQTFPVWFHRFLGVFVKQCKKTASITKISVNRAADDKLQHSLCTCSINKACSRSV